MKFKFHIFYGLLFSLALGLIFKLSIVEGVILFLSTFLVDIDHYIWYVTKSKNYNPLVAIKWYIKNSKIYSKKSVKERAKEEKGVFIFHSLFFIILLGLLSYFNRILLFVFLGLLFHIFLDLIDLYMRGEPLYIKISPFYTHIKNKGKKKIKLDY